MLSFLLRRQGENPALLASDNDEAGSPGISQDLPSDTLQADEETRLPPLQAEPPRPLQEVRHRQMARDQASSIKGIGNYGRENELFCHFISRPYDYYQEIDFNLCNSFSNANWSFFPLILSQTRKIKPTDFICLVE